MAMTIFCKKADASKVVMDKYGFPNEFLLNNK